MMASKMKWATAVIALALMVGTLAGAAEGGNSDNRPGAAPATVADAKRGTLTIESTPAGAKVFIRTGGHNGYAELGKTPLTLQDVEPGLLEYTLLLSERRLHDGSLWVEPGKQHVEEVELKPGRLFFVATDGDDEAAGSEEAPWKTLGHAAEVMEAGDTVLVRAGTYHEGPRPNWNKPSVNPKNSGTPEAPIVFRAYPGEDVKQEGPRGYGVIGVHNRDYIVWDGFTAKAIYLWGTTGTQIRNCVGCGSDVRGKPSAKHNNDAFRIEKTHGVLVRNCIGKDRIGAGLHANSVAFKMYQTKNLVIEHCEIYNCTWAIHDKSGQRSGSYNNVTRRTLIHNCGGAHWSSTRSVYQHHAYQNLIYDRWQPRGGGFFLGNSHVPSGWAIYNNTLVGAGINARGEHRRIYNNIIYKSGLNIGLPTNYSDYNCLFETHFKKEYDDVASFSAWQERGFDTHSMTRDPGFVDPQAHDYRLRPGSPCIDAGRPVTEAVGTGENKNIITVKNEGYLTEGQAPKADGPVPIKKSTAVPFVIGDTIQIGKGDDAQYARVIEHIDPHHIRLDKKVSWSEGDWVTFPFKGDAPDIGAYEFGDDRQIIGPTWKHYPKRDFSTYLNGWPR